MIRRVLISLFAFAVLFSAWADGESYWLCNSGKPDFLESVFWASSDVSPITVGKTFGVGSNQGVLNEVGGRIVDPRTRKSLEHLSPETYGNLVNDGFPYVPYSDDPKYLRPFPVPSGFSPDSSLSAVGDVLGGVASAVCGLAAAASVVCLSFLVYRKMIKTSSSV